MNTDTALFQIDSPTTADQVFESATFLPDTQKAELKILHVVDALPDFDQYDTLAHTPDEEVTPFIPPVPKPK